MWGRGGDGWKWGTQLARLRPPHRDEVVQLDELRRDGVGRVSEPRDLLLRLLEVARQVQLSLDASDAPCRAAALAHDAADEAVAPLHERDLLALGHGLHVVELEPHGRRVVDDLGAWGAGAEGRKGSLSPSRPRRCRLPPSPTSAFLGWKGCGRASTPSGPLLRRMSTRASAVTAV